MEEENKFKSNLREITSGNPKHKEEYQLDTTKNVKNLYDSRQKIIYLMIVQKLDLKPFMKLKKQDLKY